ncbi:MAG: hypothetical protein JST48_02935 [Bacteroidetes bacterium]|nr:hypothetical protein [Bacteroidota bacterium]
MPLLTQSFAQTANTSPLPAGETVIGGYLHVGNGNEVWSDATSLFFNYRGNATTTNFWNKATNSPTMSIVNSGTGMVGIGTASPISTLQVMDGSSGGSPTGTTPTQGILISGNNTAGSLNMGIDATTTFYSWIQSRNRTNGTFYNLALNPGGGYVGIGTTNSRNQLQIGSNPLDWNGNDFVVSNWHGGLAIYTGPTDTFLHSNKDINLKPGGNTSVYLTSSGKVGIGTTTPGAQLTVSRPGYTGTPANSSLAFINQSTNPNGTDLMPALELSNNGSDGYGLVSYATNNYLSGIVGIGTTSPGGYRLAVAGKVAADGEVRVFNTGTTTFPDYVFDPAYQLPTLEETEKYVNENHHLPEVPSAAEIEKDGMSLNGMNVILLKKVEELTLHLIQLKKENEQLNQRLKKLENQ